MVVRFSEDSSRISTNANRSGQTYVQLAQKAKYTMKNEYKKLREYNLDCFIKEVKHKYNLRSDDKAFFHFCEQTGLMDKILAKWVRGEFNTLLWSEPKREETN